MAVGRFQVMAILQAARALVLGMPEETAKSWGLNRAIFYAAAKRGFKQYAPAPRPGPGVARARQRLGAEAVISYQLGDEAAFRVERGGRTYFRIGGEVQTERDFERQVQARLGGVFEEAWKEALSIVKQYGREVLLSQNGFFQEVYRPRRDELAEKWTELSGRKTSTKPG